jgi:RNA recognition motif-containing protein
MNLYVSNIHFRATEDQLRSEFERYGEVSSVKIVTDRETGRSRGFGFVEMPNSSEAQSAIDALNGKEVGERPLSVKEARERDESAPRKTFNRPSGGGSGGYGGGGGNRGGGYGGGNRGGGDRY